MPSARSRQRQSFQACKSVGYSPHAIHCKMGCEPPRAPCTPAHHKTELPARQHGLCSCSRASHAAYRCYASRQSAGHAAASREARAATLCRHTCRMLESDAVVSMCRSTEVSVRALAQRDGYQRSSYGVWRPGDGVRSTSHRPCRFDTKICADFLFALDARTFSARALYAIDIAPSAVARSRTTGRDGRPAARRT